MDPTATEPSAPARWGASEWLALAACLALYLAVVRPFYGVTADDAFISFRYAQNWVAGCGPVYNCGQPPVEGYSNFLWMVLAALTLALGADPVQWMRALGLACGAGALVAMALLGRRIHRGRASPWIPLLVVGGSPFWGVNAVTGLETTGAALSVLLAALLSLRLPGDRRAGWLAGLAWGASYLMRPEAPALLLVTVVWALGVALRRGFERRQVLLAPLRPLLGFSLLAGPYFAWRLWFYGDLLPNTYYAKAGALGSTLGSNFKILAAHPVFFSTLLSAALLSAIALRRAGALYLLLLAAAMAGISLSVHNNYWMPGHRLQQTAICLLAVVAGGLGDLPRPGRRLAAAPAVLLVGLMGAVSWAVYPHTKFLANLHYARDDHQAFAMGMEIRKLARPGDWLATRDAGLVPYYAGPKVMVLDMHERSLNNRRIAHRGWSTRYVVSHRPRFIIFVSFSRDELQFVHPAEEILSRAVAADRLYRFRQAVMWHPRRFFLLYVRD
jgi:hypothetical protein